MSTTATRTAAEGPGVERPSAPVARPATETASPHAPRTGRLRRWLGPFYFTGVFWYRFHLFGVTVLPDFLIAPVVNFFTVVFFLALGRVRRAIGNNLELVLGPCGFIERQRRVWRTLSTFAWCLSERYEQFVPGRTFEEQMVGKGRWREVLADPAGFVMVTAHIGNWELASAFSVGSSGRTCHIVREREIERESQEFVEELLARHEREGYRTHFADDDPHLALELLDALRRGEIVALQGDRPRSGGRSLVVDMCGMRVPLPIGTAALARTAGAAIVPVFFYRTGRRTYRSVVRPVIRVSRGPDRQKALEEAVTRLGSEIEWAIRESPHEWFCFTDLTASG